MKRSPIILAALLLALSGCGDDGGGDVDAGPLPTDQCVNANDTPIVEALAMIDAGPGSTQTPGDYIFECLSSPTADCYSLVFDETATDEDIADCLDTCVAGTPTEGLSDGCLLCYGPATVCGSLNCAVVCITDEDDCYDCLVDNGCISALESCTGLAIP